MQVEVPGHLLNTGNSMVSKAGISPHTHWAYSRAGEPGIKYIITSMMDRHLTVEKQDLMKVNTVGLGQELAIQWECQGQLDYNLDDELTDIAKNTSGPVCLREQTTNKHEGWALNHLQQNWRQTCERTSKQESLGSCKSLWFAKRFHVYTLAPQSGDIFCALTWSSIH